MQKISIKDMTLEEKYVAYKKMEIQRIAEKEKTLSLKRQKWQRSFVFFEKIKRKIMGKIC